MGVKIKWIDPNISPLDTVEIYRASSKAGAPVKIGQVAGNIREYQDDTAARNTVNWYSLKSILGQGSSLAKPFPVGNFPDTGPGPATLAVGDWEFGLFGEVSLTDIPSFDEIFTALGVTYSSGLPTTFTKWVVGGRIVFIPTTPYHTGLGGWSAFDKVLLAPNGLEDSKMVLEKNGYGFAVRPPLVSTDYFTTPANMGAGGDATRSVCEAAAIASCMQGRDAAGFFTQYKFGDYAVSAAGTSNWFMANTYSVNGQQGVTPMGFNIATPGIDILNGASTARGFWPVLQLLVQ